MVAVTTSCHIYDWKTVHLVASTLVKGTFELVVTGDLTAIELIVDEIIWTIFVQGCWAKLLIDAMGVKTEVGIKVNLRGSDSNIK